MDTDVLILCGVAIVGAVCGAASVLIHARMTRDFEKSLRSGSDSTGVGYLDDLDDYESPDELEVPDDDSD